MVQFKAKVLYEWNANDENEISLEEGETIEVLDHRDKDGWWVGRKEDGTKGEFPGNYVQRLKEYALPSQSSPPRSVPAALPAGWAEAKDPASGDTYYFNESTGETAWDKPHVSATEGPRASDHEAMNRLANLSLANEEEEDKATHRTGRRKKGPNGGSSRGPNSKDKTRPANHSHANGYSNGGSRDEDVGFSPSRPTNGFKRTDQSPRVAAHSPEKPWRRGRPNEENFVVEKEQEDENFVVGTGGTGKLKSARQELEEAENERYELEMQRRRAEEEAAERRKIFDEEAARLEEDERKRAEEIEARKMELQQDEYRLKQEKLELEAEKAMQAELDESRDAHDAAASIQAVHRGKKARQMVEEKKVGASPAVNDPMEQPLGGGGGQGGFNSDPMEQPLGGGGGQGGYNGDPMEQPLGGGGGYNGYMDGYGANVMGEERPFPGASPYPDENDGGGGMNMASQFDDVAVENFSPRADEASPHVAGGGVPPSNAELDAQDEAYEIEANYQAAVEAEMQRIQEHTRELDDMRLDKEATAQVMAEVMSSVEKPSDLLEQPSDGGQQPGSVPSPRGGVAQQVTQDGGIVLNKDTLHLIARLVDQRLVEEFRRRDDVISEMKDAMLRLRSQMSTQAERWSAHQEQLNAQHAHDIQPHLMARDRVRGMRAQQNHLGGAVGHGGAVARGSPERPRVPKVSRSTDPVERRAAGMGHGAGQQYHHAVKPPEFDENLPRVAGLQRHAPAKKGSLHAEDHQKLVSEAALKYHPCKSIVYQASEMDNLDKDDPDPFPTQLPAGGSLDLDFVHSYRGDWGRDVGVQSHMTNVVTLRTGEIAYPAGHLVVMMVPGATSQRFYTGHSGEVTALTVHPTTDTIASGDTGKRASVQVWLAGEQSSTPTIVTELSLPKDSKAVKALDFSGDGKLLLVLSEDTQQTASIWDWRRGSMLASLKATTQPVFCMRFNPHLCVPESQAPDPDQVTYTLVSCGVRHLKFWTLYKEKEEQTGDRYTVAAQAASNRSDWKLEANVASTGRATDHADITCMTFILDSEGDTKIGVPPSGRIFTGTSNGAILVWIQLEELADDLTAMYQQGGMAPVPQIRWQAKGRLITSVAAHDGPIYDITYLPDNLGGIVTTCGRDGRIMLWSVVAGKERKRTPLRLQQTVELSQTTAGLGPPRSLCWTKQWEHHDGAESHGHGRGKHARYLAVGTLGNAICTVNPGRVTGSAGAQHGGLGGSAGPMHSAVALQSHLGKVTAVATHPKLNHYSTVATDRTIKLWDADKQTLLATGRLREFGSCVCYHPDGSVVAVGTHHGEVVIMEATNVKHGWAWHTKSRRNVGTKIRNLPEDGAGGRKGGKAPKPDRNELDNVHAADGEPSQRFCELRDIKFSPNAEVLAVASKDTNIYLLDVTQNYRKLGVLKGHSTFVSHIDFNWNGTVLQSNDASKEILYWDMRPTSGGAYKQHASAFSLRDESWATWTCPLGWSVHGIWDNHYTGSDYEIHAVARSNSGNVVCAGGNYKSVKLFPFPALPDYESRTFYAHAAAPAGMAFLHDDKKMVSVAHDGSVVLWRCSGFGSEDVEESGGRGHGRHGGGGGGGGHRGEYGAAANDATPEPGERHSRIPRPRPTNM